ncbi:hypothetical protein FAGKG844_30146 [Frankia sp. AgKG'84/4]
MSPRPGTGRRSHPARRRSHADRRARLGPNGRVRQIIISPLSVTNSTILQSTPASPGDAAGSTRAPR